MSFSPFSSPDNFHFIELYCERELLWNPNSKDYRNRKRRDAAYLEIVQQIKKPGFTKNDVRNKIKNVRSVYFQELKKIKISRNSGSRCVYEPKLAWFKKFNEILEPIIKAQSDTTSTDTILDSESNDVPEAIERKVIAENKASFTETSTVITEPSILVENSRITQSRMQNVSSISVRTPNQMNQSAKNHSPSKKKRKRIENVIIPKLLKEFDNISKVAAKHAEDSYDGLGNYVATTLRNLPPLIALEAEREIQNVLCRCKEKSLRGISGNMATPHNG